MILDDLLTTLSGDRFPGDMKVTGLLHMVEGLVDILKYGEGEEVSAAQDALRSLTGIDYLIE